jgi:hypothetical protein
VRTVPVGHGSASFALESRVGETIQSILGELMSETKSTGNCICGLIDACRTTRGMPP